MTKYQVVGIGNAIMDMIAQCDDAFLEQNNIDKGVMQLVDKTRAEELSAAMVAPVQMAGGSVANTMAGLGAMGIKTAFIGRVGDDDLGNAYANALSDDGIEFVNPPVANAADPTSRSMIFVSQDGERSMNTYLGISGDLGPEDVPVDVAGDAKILFLEGYLYDKLPGKAAFEAATKACRENGGKAGISLSDPFCVERHRDDFRKLVCELDIVIGNEHEWKSLYQTEDLNAALEQARAEAGLIVCTRSGDGVIVLQGDERHDIPTHRIVATDTTGAGDQFAAGFLYGMITGESLEIAGKMGCIAAAEVIAHYGARPESDVKDMFQRAGLITRA